jgi:hypothetical protein
MPESRPVERKPKANTTVISLPRLGGFAPSLRVARSGVEAEVSLLVGQRRNSNTHDHAQRTIDSATEGYGPQSSASVRTARSRR